MRAAFMSWPLIVPPVDRAVVSVEVVPVVVVPVVDVPVVVVGRFEALVESIVPVTSIR